MANVTISCVEKNEDGSIRKIGFKQEGDSTLVVRPKNWFIDRFDKESTEIVTSAGDAVNIVSGRFLRTDGQEIDVFEDLLDLPTCDL